MEKQIIVDGTLIKYQLKRYVRSKRVNMIVHHDGTLVVTAPQRYPMIFIERALHKNQKWIAAQLAKQKHKKNVTIEKQVVNHVKEYVRAFVHEKCDRYNAYYGFTYHRITIRQQRTRWGSCSAQGNLNFNIRLIYLSDELRDYIIVHELCHLQEMNHSQSFWDLVEERIPAHKECRRALKKGTHLS